jgi:hypothetical protein
LPTSSAIGSRSAVARQPLSARVLGRPGGLQDGVGDRAADGVGVGHAPPQHVTGWRAECRRLLAGAEEAALRRQLGEDRRVHRLQPVDGRLPALVLADHLQRVFRGGGEPGAAHPGGGFEPAAGGLPSHATEEAAHVRRRVQGHLRAEAERGVGHRVAGREAGLPEQVGAGDRLRRVGEAEGVGEGEGGQPFIQVAGEQPADGAAGLVES